MYRFIIRMRDPFIYNDAHIVNMFVNKVSCKIM